MNKFTNDSQNLQAQQQAYKAAAFEAETLEDYLDGAVSESAYLSAMEATETAVNTAVSLGVSLKDLPASQLASWLFQ